MKIANSQQISELDAEKYIIPTKDDPIFTAECDYLGYIDLRFWKQYFIPDINVCGNVFAINYADAIYKLHEWIIENPEVLNDYPKCKFTIKVIDGSYFPQFRDAKEKTVYSISASKARKYLV